MVWNEKQMGLPPGCTRLDFRDERMGTERGHRAVCHGFLPVVTSVGKGWRHCPSKQGAAARPGI